MPFRRTTATEKILNLTKRIRAVSGGTGASKTISIIMCLIDYAQDNSNKLISIVSESFPHLRRGAERDFLNIMQQHNYYHDKEWNKTDHTYTFPQTDSVIEFFSVDQSEKVKGARRDVLFINEANNITFEAFNQLEVRTNEFIFMDWNPVTEFWFYTDVEPMMDVDFITLNYLDNEALADSIVESIESRKHLTNWWKVYGLGQLGEVEGKIYTGWQMIDEIPHEARLERYGLDFGYTNDPSSIVAVYFYNGGYILDEKLYRKGMSNKQLADHLLNLDYALVVADSAEPKSIDEINNYGVSIVPSQKGKDSVVHGIQYVQEQQISVTKQSLNLIKEYKNYLWRTDREDKIINEPEDGFDHTLDAVRYAITSMNPDYNRPKKQPTRPRLYYTPRI